jgi:hypothetical protein
MIAAPIWALSLIVPIGLGGALGLGLRILFPGKGTIAAQPSGTDGAA